MLVKEISRCEWVNKGWLGKDIAIIPRKIITIRILHRIFCCCKRNFQETPCPEDRLGRSWLSPCVCLYKTYLINIRQNFKKIQIERCIRDQTSILLQKVCASMINSKVIFKSMKGTDDKSTTLVKEISRCKWVNKGLCIECSKGSSSSSSSCLDKGMPS